MITHPKIFKLDTKGKTRVWYIQEDTNLGQYRTIAGIDGGNLVTSEWTVCVGKQGRTNHQQATFEVGSAYQNKLSREYHKVKSDTAKGSHFFKPMLAKEYTGWKGPCFAQFKFDGARCIATKDGLFSRQGKPFVSAPHIMEALAPVFKHNPEIVLDGELYNHELKDDFGQIMSLIRQSKPTADDLARSRELVQYHVYDIPSLTDNFDIRKEVINEALLMLTGDCVFEVETFTATTEAELDSVHTLAIAEGYEGTMIRLDAPYEQKRSGNLLKRKEFKTEEFKVLSINEGLGNWSGVAKAITCELPDGRTFGAGIKGTRERAAVLLGETWTQATVRFFDYTPDGIPRFPVAIDFHNGRSD